jgi:hypothetical protein
MSSIYSLIFYVRLFDVVIPAYHITSYTAGNQYGDDHIIIMTELEADEKLLFLVGNEHLPKSVNKN